MRWIQFAQSQLDPPEPIVTTPSSDSFFGWLIVLAVVIVITTLLVRIFMSKASLLFAISCGWVAALVLAVFVMPWFLSDMIELPNEISVIDLQRAAESTAGLAAYDESIPETSMQPSYWVAHDDLESLTRSSDIAFVGRITGYTEEVLVVHDDPTEAPIPTTRVYDGIVFTVDEVLIGELPAGEIQVTIATPTLLRNNDGTTRFRISASPIEIVRPGIFARNETDRQRYIVYGVAGHKGTPYYAAGVYFFNTPGGVAPVLADDRIGRGADRPLAGTLEEENDAGTIVTPADIASWWTDTGLEEENDAGTIVAEGERTGTPTVEPGPELANSDLGLDDARTAAQAVSLTIE